MERKNRATTIRETAGVDTVRLCMDVFPCLCDMWLDSNMTATEVAVEMIAAAKEHHENA